jgi:hypothetical protein
MNSLQAYENQPNMQPIFQRPAPLNYDDRQISLTAIINAAVAANSNNNSNHHNNNHMNNNNRSNLSHSSSMIYDGTTANTNTAITQYVSAEGMSQNGLHYPAMLRDISLTSINMEFVAPISPPALPFRGLSGTFFPDGDGDISLLPTLRGLSDFQMTQLNSISEKETNDNSQQSTLNKGNSLQNGNNTPMMNHQVENQSSIPANLNHSNVSLMNNTNSINNSPHTSNNAILSPQSTDPHLPLAYVPVQMNQRIPSPPSLSQSTNSSLRTSSNGMHSQYSYSYPNLNEDLLPTQTTSVPLMPPNENDHDTHYRKRHRLDDSAMNHLINSTTSISAPTHSPLQQHDPRLDRTQSSSALSSSPVERPKSRVSTASSSNHSSPTLPQSQPTSKRANSLESQSPINENDKEYQKKMKHQLTDRQRRAKIKESMDQLKSLLPVEKEKADQATVIAESVQYVKSLKDEVNELRKKIAEMELSQNERNGRKEQLTYRSFTGSPLESVQHGLNGAGVSYWRLGLDCKLLEVNIVFEMLTGYSREEIVGTIPCRAPLYASTSFLPKAFMRYFANNGVTAASYGKTSVDNLKSFDETVDSDKEKDKKDENEVYDIRKKQTLSTAPLFPVSTIANFPVVPQSELQSFFPQKSKSPNDSQSLLSAKYLVNHLINLPPTHVLKLLTRLNTTYGDTLELIQTLSLVRTPDGLPDHIVSFTTPDSRRLVKPSALLNRNLSEE